MSEALKERERLTAKDHDIEASSPDRDYWAMQLTTLDEKYAKSPSQKLLDERLKILTQMMHRR